MANMRRLSGLILKNNTRREKNLAQFHCRRWLNDIQITKLKSNIVVFCHFRQVKNVKVQPFIETRFGSISCRFVEDNPFCAVSSLGE